MQQPPPLPSQDALAPGLAGLSLETGHHELEGADAAQRSFRGPPSLRPKRSQRFTVPAHPHAANEAPPVPSMPSLLPPSTASSTTTSALDRTPSSSSYSHSSGMSDTDSNPDGAPSPTSFAKKSGSTLNPLAAPMQPFAMGGVSPLSQPANLPSIPAYSPFAAPGARGRTTPGPYGAPVVTPGAASAGRWTENSAAGYFGQPSQAGTGQTPGPAPAVMVVDDEEVIPTAIVIKNIPFSVKKEQLLAVIEDLMIPSPYAFNYHFDGDNRLFRGLAFANFRSPHEADSAVVALNGYDLQGRKLRVEYKKVLQQGEKERIEKEKAIRRIRSMQIQKDQELQHQYGGYASSRSRESSHQGGTGEEDYGEPLPHSSFGGASPGSSLRNLAPPPGSFTSGPPPPLPNSEGSPPLDQHAGGPGASKELNMNDPQTLEIYSRVLLFKDDSMRDELAFARSLTAQQRRVVHQVAKKLGMDHRSEGVGEDRHVVVLKPGTGGGSKSRSTTPGRSQSYLAPENMGAGVAMGRKKSMPDMRYNAGGVNGSSYVPPGSSAARLGRRSNANLREGYASSGRKASGHRIPSTTGDGSSLFGSHPFSPAPPVPNLPSSLFGGEDGNGGHNHGAGAGGILRQPRGPDAGSKGFGEKMRSVRAPHLQPPAPSTVSSASPSPVTAPSSATSTPSEPSGM